MYVPVRVIRPHQAASAASPAVVSTLPLQPAPPMKTEWQAAAEIPTRFGVYKTHVFRTSEPGDGASFKEHVALVYGSIVGASDVPVRIHSECMTSEVFGSLKCDCKEQLDAALAEIAQRGMGAVLYLRQEGRGIGLANKIRAYGLQEKGADTVDANRLLGLPDDAREYTAAAAMLAHFGVQSVQLMTNNPAKVDALRSLGVEVTGRLPVIVPPNPYSAGYLETKRARMAHELPSHLASHVDGSGGRHEAE
ncbi:MAG: 3,4-dihydroxy-2-butanone 4-phosphate synthase [Labilithrix sp.]|nr:3,4-dihydroxy-2-butanone 4-phosphate synthase [Labilithrix sp.]